MNTNRKITLLICAILLTVSGHAQIVRYGIKGGANFSSLPGNESEFAKYLTGGHLGFWLNLPLPGALSVQPEFLLTQKGTRNIYEQDNGTSLAEIKLALNYLEMPVHLVYQVFRNIEIEAGPYWAYLIEPKVETYISSPFGNMSFWDTLDENDFERFDLGISIGTRIQFNKFYLGLNYKAGFDPVSKESNFTRLMLGEAVNQNFQLYGALRF